MKALLFPGQGSQAMGMGAGLFERFPEITAAADSILGYSVAELCLADAGARLSRTQYAQPAIYVVNALHLAAHKEEGEADCAFVVGHSLGEYNALAAANAFDFETGLRLVKKRGELFEAAGNGAMVALLGLKAAQVRAILSENGTDGVEVANLNTGTQVVIAGPADALERLHPVLEKAGCLRYQRLNVSGAFHSRHMRSAKEGMSEFLRGFRLRNPSIPVVANVTARPYLPGRVADFLVEQVDEPVKWNESIHFLLRNGVTEFVEIGHGRLLTRMVEAIRREIAAPGGPVASSFAA
jgi:malonyl CoA-acyl carrier protein transacylase